MEHAVMHRLVIRDILGGRGLEFWSVLEFAEQSRMRGGQKMLIVVLVVYLSRFKASPTLGPRT
jgi:hypothetical protein